MRLVHFLIAFLRTQKNLGHTPSNYQNVIVRTFKVSGCVYPDLLSSFVR
ncbi:Uncharacterised protein [Klebsiella oxytoca]|uniref:Uncharacterized protein n=1 Tax=Raoultella ornithinolytica TaxID=54291 RepID=A0A7G9A6C9_RAOOR|nr:Hypothetical protein [Raoultella ornithinolytica]SAQ05591.1 Uncharacterised protein [Klebsiella oxytoca]